MMEAYQAYADLYDMMDLTEAAVRACAIAANETTVVEVGGRSVDLGDAWERLPMVDAVERHTGHRVEVTGPDEAARAIAAELGVPVPTEATSGLVPRDRVSTSSSIAGSPDPCS